MARAFDSSSLPRRAGDAGPQASSDARARTRTSASSHAGPRGCACGGGCPACSSASGAFAIKGATSVAASEHEAERAANAATRSPTSRVAASPLAPLAEQLSATPLHSPGRALAGADRIRLEAAFGHDLSAVRLHDAPAEHSLARSLGASAFASGTHIVHRGGFNGHVLAHEVAHIVQSAMEPRSPAIQRFESFEHEDLGDRSLDELQEFLRTSEGEEWAKQRGLDAKTVAARIAADPLKAAGGKIIAGKRKVGESGSESVGLTPGEIISLSGDFYKGPNELAAAASKPIAKAGDKSEIDQLKDAIGDERKGKLSDANQTYESITKGRYLDLAKRNDEHFAPKDRTAWRALHEQAIAEAAKAGPDVDKLNHALLVDAAGGHFLTDAYASGHLFRKNELLAAIAMHLAAHPLHTMNPAAQTYAAIVSWSGNADQLVLKNIHDRMNREGFEVTNARGMKWRTFGDALLAKTPDTQRIAALAIFESRQQVYAAQRGETVNPDDVQSFMPDDATLGRATLTAISYVPQAASAEAVQQLMFSGRKLASTQFPFPIGPIVEANLAAITDPGLDRRMRLNEDPQRSSSFGPQLAPQFSIPIPLP